MRNLLALSTLVACLGAAQAQDVVKVGYIGDLSGVYGDFEGKGGAVAMQMAIDDFGGKVLGKRVELLVADHQNKADIAGSKAREWMDTQNIAMLFGGANSATALAMAGVAEEKKRVYFNNGAGNPALTNDKCSPYTVHYAYDTRAYTRSTSRAIVEDGGKTWYFLTVDYAAGYAFEADAEPMIKDTGGSVLGAVRHPINASDFSSFLLKAQGSKAQVLGLANAGGDTVNAIKAAREFGLTKSMKLAALLFFITDVHSLGLRNTEGLLLTTSWDWNLTPESRAFGKRFFEKMKRMPTDVQAADYSAMTTYLKAVQAVNTTDSDKVMAQLKKTRVDDMYAKGYIRADGRFVQDNLYLMRVKSPGESKEPWDYFKLVAKVPGEKVYTTKAESKCSFWK